MADRQVRFVDITMTKYLSKLNDNQVYDDCIYFVSTNFTEEDNVSNNVPYLLFKGKNLIGNSGLLTMEATNGFINLNGSSFTTYRNSSNIMQSLTLSSTNISPRSVTIQCNIPTMSDTYVDVALIGDENNEYPNLGSIIKYSEVSSPDQHEIGQIDYTTGDITFDLSNTNYTNSVLGKSTQDSQIATKYSYLINIEVPSSLSSNIIGIPGQTMFIVNKFTAQDGSTSYSTYLYFWDDTETLTGIANSIYTKGAWKNANLALVQRLSYGGVEFTDEDLRKLKQLIARDWEDDIPSIT